MSLDTLLADLRPLLGDRLSTSQAIRDHHARDESHHLPAPPDAVAFPISTAEVSKIAALCSHHHVPIIPFGAGSGLEGAVLAVAGGLTVDLSRMDAILAIHADDMDATVQAGVRRRALNTALRDTGLYFPIDPGADASLGGMVGTRASGTNAVRYGTMRENVLGLTVVLADGQVIRTGGRARKSSAGYDLTRLFVGSEGTLGIVTEVTVRLHTIPETALAAVISFTDLDGAVAAATAVIQAGLTVGRVELLDEDVIPVINRHTGRSLPVRPTLYFDFHGAPDATRSLADQVSAITADHGAVATEWAVTASDRDALWETRRLAMGWARSEIPGARAWPGDVCVPISALPRVLLETKADLRHSPVPAYLIGHVGDGNFHCVFMVQPDRPDQLREVERLNDRLVSRALAVGGTSTGEHGIGLGKRDYLEAEHGAAAVAAMRAIKHTFDPLGLLNPGKVLPPLISSAAE